MILKLIQFAIGLSGATLLFWLGLAYEHRPAGAFSFQAWKWGPICVCYRDPGGPWAQLVALQAEASALAAHARAVEVAQAAISANAEAAEAVAQTRIRTVYRTIEHDIPTAIPPAVDRGFPLSIGFVRVHDAAARGAGLPAGPDAAGEPDDAASDVAESAAAAVIAANYGACHADQQRLTDLQAWVQAQRQAR